MNITITFNPIDNPKAAEAFAVFLVSMSAPAAQVAPGLSLDAIAGRDVKPAQPADRPPVWDNVVTGESAQLGAAVNAAPPPPPADPVVKRQGDEAYAVTFASPADAVAATSAALAADPGDIDVNGVRCDRTYCAPSKKADGTWARKRGTDEAAFTKWYASQVSRTVPLPPSTPAVNEAPAPVAPPPPTPTPVVSLHSVATPMDPTQGVGQFMTWVSGLQAAGRLTQEQVKVAFTEEKILQPMLFNKALNTADLLARLVKNITAKVGQ